MTNENVTERVADAVRSFSGGVGLILGTSAVATLGYMHLGDWMIDAGLVGTQGHFFGAVIAFIMAAVLQVSALMIFCERFESITEETE